MATIYEKLKAYSDSDYYGFHMPGHKRKMHMSWDADPYTVDITEIEGFDDLHHAEGILKEAQERAARIYHADETHFLVNGSTVGILSAIAGVMNKGDQILVARNCHKSVYHAIYMNELNPVYLYPRFDSELQLNIEISAEDVRRALNRYPQIRAVMIVSPTYDGIVSDVAEIAKAAHEKGLPLIVDEAHGAHFGFHPYFPENANQKGADIVIHSVHKTLPAFTQTALLHMNGNLVNREKVRRYLHMLQSSSPSYILMAGIDQCMEMLDHHCEEVFDPYVERLKRCREELGKCEHIRLAETKHYDKSKLVLSVAGLTKGLADTYGAEATGIQLQEDLLNQYHLQMEMAAGTYVIAMTSVGDTDEGMKRLIKAIYELDKKYKPLQGAYNTVDSDIVPEEIKKSQKKEKNYDIEPGHLPQAEVIYSPAQVIGMKDAGADGFQFVPLTQSEGYISAEYAYLYPPGIPMLVPGERITAQIREHFQWYMERTYEIQGVEKEGYIEVWTHG